MDELADVKGPRSGIKTTDVGRAGPPAFIAGRSNPVSKHRPPPTFPTGRCLGWQARNNAAPHAPGSGSSDPPLVTTRRCHGCACSVAHSLPWREETETADHRRPGEESDPKVYPARRRLSLVAPDCCRVPALYRDPNPVHGPEDCRSMTDEYSLIDR